MSSQPNRLGAFDIVRVPDSQHAAAPAPVVQSFFQSIALPLAMRGFKVIPVIGKKAFLDGHQKEATSDILKISKMWATYKDCNVAVHCLQEKGGVCILDDEGKIDLGVLYTAETSNPAPVTYRVVSTPTKPGERLFRSHWYFFQTPETMAIPTNITEDTTADEFSLRLKNYYAVGEGSKHPDHGGIYTDLTKASVIPMPVDFLVWLQGRVRKESNGKPKTQRNERGLIAHGDMHKPLVSAAGKFREMGMSANSIFEALMLWADENCEQPINESRIRQYAESVEKYPKGDLRPQIIFDSAPTPAPALVQVMPEIVLDAKEAAEIPDLPEEAIVPGILGDILWDYFPCSPRAYAYPALLSVAGVMVPMDERRTDVDSELAISMGVSGQTNTYTALVGLKETGKTQAIEYAVGNLGLRRENYSTVKAGSVEGLLAKLEKSGNGILHTRQLMLDVDEWSGFFKKAGIDNATFIDTLNSGFYKPEFHLTIKGGKEINLNCALSIIGGITPERVPDCFNAETTGGFHDRFLFGHCPSGYVSQYMPFDVSKAAFKTDPVFRSIKPTKVQIDRSVWELANSWKREDPTLGRAVEMTVRCCKIIASFDEKKEITARDLEVMRPFLEYQQTCRKIITPDAAITYDAKMSNGILGWLKRHADSGIWANQRDLKKGIYRLLDSLGPGSYNNAIRGLQFIRAIETMVQSNEGTRPSHLIRLAKGM